MVTTCTPEQPDEVIEELRALLSRDRDTCLVNDAMWLRHEPEELP